MKKHFLKFRAGDTVTRFEIFVLQPNFSNGILKTLEIATIHTKIKLYTNEFIYIF